MFTTSRLECTKALNRGLFGGTSDPGNAQWHLLDKFPKSDIIAFTAYPYLIYSASEDIPDNYYSEIRTHISKPVAFTEIGWYTDDSIEGWENSEEEQAEFISRFFDLTADLNTEMIIWLHMYAQDINRILGFRWGFNPI